MRKLTYLVFLLAGCAGTPNVNEPVIESIVFASARTGDGDLYALNLDDLSVSPLITTPAGEGGPQYDAARNRIVYQVFSDDAVELHANGRRLMADPNGDTAPAWSADGRYIVFSADRDGNENLYLAAVDGSSERRLTDGRHTDRYPVFSPDGSRIAFARELAGTWDLQLLDLGTGTVRPLTAAGVYVGHPDFSPDGERLVFDRYYGDQAEIAMLDIDSGATTRLTNRPGNDLRPRFSLDGQRVAFAADPTGENEWDLWLLDLGSGTLSQLSDHPGFDGAPVFVPESAWIGLASPYVP